MKQLVCTVLIALTAAAVTPSLVAAQTIDKPVATVSLIRPEVYSLLQYKTDLQRVEQTLRTQLTPEQRRQFLENQIDTMLFKQYCEREKIIVSDSEINQAYLQMKGQLGPTATDADVDVSLRSNGVFVDAKTYIRQQMLLSRYLQVKKADALKAIKTPSSDDVLKEYDLEKAKLIRPDSVRVSIMYIDLTGKSPDEWTKGKILMQSIADKVKSDPSSFDTLMLKSMDPSSTYRAKNSVVVPRNQQAVVALGQSFVDIAFSLKVGEISPLIANPAGYEIVRVNEILPQKQLTLSDPIPDQPNATVQEYIVYELTMKARQEFLKSAQDELIAQLRKEGTVKIFEQNLTF